MPNVIKSLQVFVNIGVSDEDQMQAGGSLECKSEQPDLFTSSF